MLLFNLYQNAKRDGDRDKEKINSNLWVYVTEGKKTSD